MLLSVLWFLVPLMPLMLLLPICGTSAGTALIAWYFSRTALFDCASRRPLKKSAFFFAVISSSFLKKKNDGHTFKIFK